MRHSILMAGISLLAISGPVLAGNPTPPNNVGSAPGVQLAQVQVQVPSASTPTAVVTTPGTSPSAVTSTSGSVPASTTVVVTAPTAPPPAQAETPPPAPGPRYVWAQGHWSWDGTQYVWNPGRYVIPPTTVARWTPGYWQQSPTGWVWTDGSWN